MKKATLLMLFLAIGISAFAQNTSRYEAAMKKNLTMLDTTRSTATLTTLANNFERIAIAKGDQWLPFYYASLSRVRTAFQQEDKGNIDGIADKAEELADQAKTLKPDMAEMLCLRSMIASARIRVDPRARGEKYGTLAAQDLAKAKKLAPDNPRVYLLTGQNLFYTPAQWGGGKDKAKPVLEKAIGLFKSAKPASKFAPHWGKDLAIYLLTQCK